MANIQIPLLPAATSLSGAELLEAVQSGSSVKVTARQITGLSGQYAAEAAVSASDAAASAVASAVSASDAAASAVASAVSASDAAASAVASDASAIASANSAISSGTYANSSYASQLASEEARDAAISGSIMSWPTTAAGIGSGIAGVTSIVGGSGGTNGTFSLAFSGGTQVLPPVGVFTVAGGSLVSVVITYPGYYSAGTPTLSFAASSGLTSASATAQMASNTPVNGFFAVRTDALNIGGISARIYRNVSGVATYVTDAPSNYLVAEALEYNTPKQRYIDNLNAARSGLPKAAIVVLLGQSLNASRSFTPVQRYAPRDVYMPVGGIGLSEFDMTATNVEWTPNSYEYNSYVPMDEGSAKQSPAAGVANALVGGKFSQVYICSAALGARSFGILQGAGPRASMYSIIYRMCEQAVTQGYDPIVFGAMAEGEADAAAGTSEAETYSLAVSYMRMFQLAAAQAMQKPNYIAPIAVSYPVQSNNALGAGANDRAVKEGLRQAIRDVVGAIDIGGIYQWPVSADLVHPTAMGYVQRGEAYGRTMKMAYEQSQFGGFDLEIADVTISGTTFKALFTQSIVRDAATAWGTALAGTEGFQWFDNGSEIVISDLVYQGNTVTGTLATSFVGTLAQQTLGIASAANSPTGGLDEVPGSYVRVISVSWSSWVNSAYINYIWAKPQTFSNVRVAG